MQIIQKTASVLCLVMLLVSCVASASSSTATPTITRTFRPTARTITPGETYQPLWMPSPGGKPAAAWEGIPVMPSALRGEAGDSSYTFTVRASLDKVREYYKAEMHSLGWDLFAVGEGSPDVLLMKFNLGAEVVSLSAFKQKGDLVYVSLDK